MPGRSSDVSGPVRAHTQRSRALKRMALAAICLAAARPASALAQGAAPAFSFPKKIGVAELVNTEDFEPKSPGLGQVGQYTFQGWRLSMYVYDKKRTDIADTPNAGQIKPELDASVADIFEAKRQGHYSRVDEGTPFSMPPMGTPPVFQCRAFIIQMAPKPNGPASAPYESYMCVTTSRRKFVKLRLSSTTPPGDQATVFTPVAASVELIGRMLQRQ